MYQFLKWPLTFSTVVLLVYVQHLNHSTRSKTWAAILVRTKLDPFNSSAELTDATVAPRPSVHNHVPFDTVLPVYESTVHVNMSSSLRIAVLQVLSPKEAATYQIPSASVSCYAARHGYHYHLETAQMDATLMPGLSRWRTLMKLLRFYDYVMLVSGDVMPVNHTKKLEDYLELAPMAEMYFPLRFTCNLSLKHICWPHLNTELAIFRNSETSFKMLRELLTLDPKLQGLWVDMAALMHVIYHISMGIDEARECNSESNAFLDGKRMWSDDFLHQQYLACPAFWEMLAQGSLPKFLHVFNPGQLCRDIGIPTLGPFDFHPWNVQVNGTERTALELLNGDLLLRGVDFFLHTKQWEKFVSPSHLHCMDANTADAELVPTPFSSDSDSEAFLKTFGSASQSLFSS